MSERRGSIGRARCPMPAARLRVCETFQQSSFPRRRESTGRGGDGFPSARERRAATAHPQSSARIHAPTTVIPATAGIHGEGRRWVPVCTGTTGGDGAPTIVGENPRTHNRHSRDGGNPRRGRRWVPVCTGTTGGGGRTHNRRRESTAPQSSFPRRRESTAGGRRWMGSRLHGNDERRRAHPQSSARIHGSTIVIPATAGIRGGGRRWVPVCTGTTGGGGRTHKRHSREWSNARVSLYGNDGARPCGSWSCTRAGRRPSPSRSRRRCCASGLWRSRPPARTRA